MFEQRVTSTSSPWVRAYASASRSDAALLAAYGIPTVETRIAVTEDEAVKAADEIGYPIVLKLHSLTITHKTDVGGVLLNLRDAEAVRKGFQGIRVNFKIKADVPDGDLLALGQLGQGHSPVFDSLAYGVPIAVTAERM